MKTCPRGKERDRKKTVGMGKTERDGVERHRRTKASLQSIALSWETEREVGKVAF